MAKFIATVWNMCKIAMAYALALIGLAFGIPGYVLSKTGKALVCCGDYIADTVRTDDCPEIVKRISKV